MQSKQALAHYDRALFADDSPVVKTRTELKRELNQTLADGEQAHFLNQVEAQLDCFHHQLDDLSAKRATIMRQISVRQRKLNDWKGKIPRTAHVNVADAQREMQRVGHMPCTRVARFQNDTQILVEKALCSALQAVEGFSKLWLLFTAPPDLRFHAMCSAHQLCLCLVHVCACDVKRGVLTIEPIQFEGDASKLDQVVIIDMKPYLSYCEAWTEKQPHEQEALNHNKPLS